MIRRLLLAAVILAALAFFVGLLLAAQTVGVEAWHDSALPQGAFVAIRSAGSGAGTHDPSPAEHPALPQSRTPSPLLRAVLRLAAVNPVAPAREQTFPATSVTGIASWYEYVEGQAAAGPALRVGDWRGRVVRVCTATACIRVTLSDFMRADRLIDLDAADFQRLAPLSQGLQEVTISW